jgi:hypothetical protein
LRLVAVRLLDGFELLHLVWRKDRAELLSRGLSDCTHLLVEVSGCERGVASQGCDLLVAAGENWLQLRRLIGGEIQFFGEPDSLAAWVGRVCRSS